MSFGEELAKIDTVKVDEIFDDVLKSPATATGLEADDQEFIEKEVARSDVQYPVFQALFTRFKDFTPSLLQAGMSEERVHGILIGLYISQLVLSNYAEREIPDTLFPQGESGPAE